MGRLAAFNDARRRLRQQRRERLMLAERVLGWGMACAPSLLVLAGVLCLLNGAPRVMGIALLVVALITMAVPIGPILRARVRRGEAREKAQ